MPPLLREPVLNHSPGHGAVAAVVVWIVLLHLIHDGAGDLHREVVGFFPVRVGPVVARAALDESHLGFRNKGEKLPGFLADVLHALVASA